MKNNNLFKFSSKALLISIILINNFFFSQTVPNNTRIIEPSSTQGIFAKAFVRHLNSAKSEMFYTVLANADNTNYFGQIVNKGTRLISRLSSDGLPLWTAKFIGDVNYRNLNASTKYLANVDKDDNFYVVVTTKSTATFVDSSGNIINLGFLSALTGVEKIILKISKTGNLLWYKSIDSAASDGNAIISDLNGDLYVFGSSDAIIDNYNIPGVFLAKINGLNGNVIFVKNFDYASSNLYSVFQMIPVFDSQNSLYLFLEPINYDTTKGYTFNSITVPSNINNLDNLMLKFDANGNVVFAKNFYANATANYSYSWINDAIFDGTNFILLGNLMSTTSLNYYLGLDNVQFPKNYSTYAYSGLLAKVSLDGIVIWQKAIESKDARGFYTNVDLDENKNIYSYLFFRDKTRFDGIEHSFDATNGNKIISKFDSSGNLKYFYAVDGFHDMFNGGNNYADYYKLIDVIGEDKINCSGFTAQSNFLNYPLFNTTIPKTYIATFGKLGSYYLTPKLNYMLLTNTNISNNPNNDNTFSFDLVNNVDWSANSDQSWLNLSSINLTSKNPLATISGNGDAKITLTADTNNTGLQRTANVLFSGASVSSKTVIVTQTAVLGTNESRTFVIMLYPNPTSDFLNIQSQEKINGAEIYDISGKLILKSNVQDKKINVNSLQKGTYLIKLYTEKGIVNSKFIKN